MISANNGIVGLKYTIPLLPFPVTASFVNHQQILTWPTVLGHTYQLQATNSLAGANSPWPNIGPAVVAPTSGTLSYTNNNPGSSVLFYRVLAQ